MAYGYLCVRCGHEEKDHQPNLVNEPAEDGFDWIEKLVEGFSMTILKCMETTHSAEYTAVVEDLDLYCMHPGYGYTSPDPSHEAEKHYEEVSQFVIPVTTVIAGGRVYVGD